MAGLKPDDANTSKWTRLKYPAVLVMIVIFGTMIYFHWKQARLDRLYREAEDFSSTEKSVQAVREIASIGGKHSERILRDLATTDHSLVNDRVQIAAIEELGKNQRADVAELLASQVTIDTPFDVRKASAEALESSDCTAKCTKSLLSYLKTVYDGQLNLENRLAAPLLGESDAETKQILDSEQRDLYRVLYRVLMKHAANTNDELREKYGLGGENPEPFAIHFAIESLDQDACSLLARSRVKLAKPLVLNHTSRDELEAALTRLGCGVASSADSQKP